MMETADVEKMLYFRHRSATDKEELLSEKTWDDLNGEALFVRVDRTSSAIGRQYLYSLLRYDRVSGVSRCEEVVDGFTADKTLRHRLLPQHHPAWTPVPGSRCHRLEHCSGHGR